MVDEFYRLLQSPHKFEYPIYKPEYYRFLIKNIGRNGIDWVHTHKYYKKDLFSKVCFKSEEEFVVFKLKEEGEYLEYYTNSKNEVLVRVSVYSFKNEIELNLFKEFVNK